MSRAAARFAKNSTGGRPTSAAAAGGFVERVVERAPGYPMVVRTLAVRTLLHSIAAHLCPDDGWPPLLADALGALGAAGDEPRPEE